MITTKDICFSYQVNQPVLRNIDLNISKGCLFGLLGPNGAGKSTLISLICGLYQPTQGCITIAGLNYSSARKSILGKLAVVPQEYAFYLQLSVIENIKFFSGLYHNNNEQIEAALALSGLSSHKTKLAEQLSGGLKRRLNLAIGLLNEPELLILDEPTVGIDPQSRHFILQAIKDINQRGTTVIYTSHYMEEVEQVCDEIAIMDHGKILKQGDLKQLLNSEQFIEIDLEGYQALDPDKISSLLTSYGLNIEGQSCTGELAEGKTLVDLLQHLKTNNLTVSRMSYGKQSLESVFFRLTRSTLRD